MNTEKYSISAEFLRCQDRELFSLLLQPVGVEVRGCILFLPPFAEEMNLSRHIVSCQGRQLAAAGYNVMLLDLTGCGDAGGEFSDATWETWLQDADFAADVLSTMGAGPLILWGLRAGALLAAELAQSRTDVARLLLWQAVLNGEQQVDQFLRLQTIASKLGNAVAFDRKSLWSELRAGRSLQVAGYELSSSLALEMARARLIDTNPGCPVSWVELGYAPDRSLSVPSANVVARWQGQGLLVDSGYVDGEPFWRTIGAQANPELQQITLNMVAQT